MFVVGLLVVKLRLGLVMFYVDMVVMFSISNMKIVMFVVRFVCLMMKVESVKFCGLLFSVIVVCVMEFSLFI